MQKNISAEWKKGNAATLWGLRTMIQVDEMYL